MIDSKASRLPSFLCLLFSPSKFAQHGADLDSCARASRSDAGLRLCEISAKRPGIEEKFLAVPNAKLAGEHLKTLTAEPHMAATPEDHKTAEYVAQKFRAAGLDTEIVPYRVLMNQPKVVKVEAFDAAGKQLMIGPNTRTRRGRPRSRTTRAL